MRSSPSIVPMDDDHDTYLVLDDFGRLGLAWRETDPGDTQLETVIRHLLEGQYSSPVRIIGFNTAEGWSRDVSEDVAKELRLRCDAKGRDVPDCVRDFVERFEDRKARAAGHGDAG
jgi:hypothetical protein